MPLRRKTRLVAGAAITSLVVGSVGAFEGLRLVAYKDPIGIPTVCFGETKGVSLGQKYTLAECQGMLVESLQEHEAGMVACLRNPDAIPDKTYGAFLSFTYNVGTGAFCGSTMARLINAGQLEAACEQLPRWVRAGGRVLKGLVRRRAEERKLCLEGLKT